MDLTTGHAVGMVLGIGAGLVAGLLRGRLLPVMATRTGTAAVLAVAFGIAAASLATGRPAAGLLAAAAGVLGLLVAERLRRGPDAPAPPRVRGRVGSDGGPSLLLLLVGDL